MSIIIEICTPGWLTFLTSFLSWYFIRLSDIILTSYRVDPADTLYTGACPSGNDINDDDEDIEQPRYCHCRDDGREECGPGYDVITCPIEYMGNNLKSNFV